MAEKVRAEVDYDHQHGPIVRAIVGDTTVAIYLAHETAIATTSAGQYGVEVTGPWHQIRLLIRKWIDIRENLEKEAVVVAPLTAEDGLRYSSERATISLAEFCPHCNPCRHAHKLIEAEEAMRSIAFSLGVGGYNSKDFNPKWFEEKIREGINTIIRVERDRDDKSVLKEAEALIFAFNRLVQDIWAEISYGTACGTGVLETGPTGTRQVMLKRIRDIKAERNG